MSEKTRENGKHEEFNSYLLKEVKKLLKPVLTTKNGTTLPRLKIAVENNYLTIECLKINSYMPSIDKNYTYTLLCAQSLNDYDTFNPLRDRIIIMLTEQLVSQTQHLESNMDKILN
jgi:hypothetical protein